MEPNGAGATYPLARGVLPELASLSVWGLARVAGIALLLLTLRLLRLLPRATWPVAQAWVSYDHWTQYRAQIEALAQLDDHLLEDMGLPRRGPRPPKIEIWDAF